MNMTAVWIPCPNCDEFLCTIHGMHAHDCPCPPIEGWTNDPYSDRPDGDPTMNAKKVDRLDCPDCGGSGFGCVGCNSRGYFDIPREDPMTATHAPKPTTRTIAGHPFTLAAGRTYQAGRSMMGRCDVTTAVTIADVTDGITNAPVVLTVPGLTRDEANALLNEFNGSAATGFRRAW